MNFFLIYKTLQFHPLHPIQLQPLFLFPPPDAIVLVIFIVYLYLLCSSTRTYIYKYGTCISMIAYMTTFLCTCRKHMYEYVYNRHCNQSTISFMFHHTSTSISHIIVLTVLSLVQPSYVLRFVNPFRPKCKFLCTQNSLN